MLLDSCPSVIDEKCNRCGRTALAWAAHHGHIHVVNLLLERGADRTIDDKDGNTPRHLAAYDCNAECYERLSMRNKWGKTAWDIEREWLESKKSNTAADTDATSSSTTATAKATTPDDAAATAADDDDTNHTDSKMDDGRAQQ